MAKLTDSIGTFQTGDLVFTRYPPTSPQPIHVTVYLAPREGLGQSYVHAGASEVEIADVSTYADDKDSGGYLHAHPTDAGLRENVAEVAALFARTAKKTPYGSYPSSKDFQRMGSAPQSPHASRFTGMIRTASFNEIPFEFPALHRLLKWTQRAIEDAPLSENRGITCAAFVAACHQVARLRAFFDLTGTRHQPGKLRDCLHQLDTLVQTKVSLRQGLEVLGTDERTGKPIYRDQAYREHSNRALTQPGRGSLQDMSKRIDGGSLSGPIRTRLKKNAESPLPALEKIWLVIQTQMLGIHESMADLLENIIGPDFLFDAKYVSSPLLAQRVREAQGWNTTEYKDY